jgi:hypothetical protein
MDQRLAVLMLCDEAERFFSSQLGKYVLGVSEQEVRAAVEDLKTVDPTDANKIRELQAKISTAEAAILWMAETIANGRQEMQIIDQEEGEYGSQE